MEVISRRLMVSLQVEVLQLDSVTADAKHHEGTSARSLLVSICYGDRTQLGSHGPDCLLLTDCGRCRRQP